MCLITGIVKPIPLLQLPTRFANIEPCAAEANVPCQLSVKAAIAMKIKASRVV